MLIKWLIKKPSALCQLKEKFPVIQIEKTFLKEKWCEIKKIIIKNRPSDKTWCISVRLSLPPPRLDYTQTPISKLTHPSSISQLYDLSCRPDLKAFV